MVTSSQLYTKFNGANLIVIDGYYLHQNRGMSKYLKNILFGADLNKVLIVTKKGSLKKNNDNFLILPNMPYPLWEQVIIPLVCLFYRANVLLSPYNSAPCILPVRTKRICVIHDLIFFNQAYKRKNIKIRQTIGAIYRKIILKYVFKKLDDIVVVSNYTAKCVSEVFGEQFIDKILLVQNTTSVASQYSKFANFENYIDKNFIFSVSGIAPHKNINHLISSFIASQLSKTHDLIIAGLSKIEQNMLFKKFPSIEFDKNVKFVTDLSDGEISFLHQNCDIFVSNSLEEGFGIPLLDSLQEKKIICCSNIPVYRELAQDNVYYFNPKRQKCLTKLLDKHAQVGLPNLNRFNFKHYVNTVELQKQDFWFLVNKYN